MNNLEIFFQGLIILFDSSGFIFISIGIMIAFTGWGFKKFLEGLAVNLEFEEDKKE